MILAQGITHPQGIAPEPIEFVAIDGGLNRILAGDQSGAERFSNRRLFAEQNRIAINAFSCHAVKPLGNVQALDSHNGSVARFGLQAHASVAEAVLRKFISVASHVKEYRLVHQAWLVKCHATGAVGKEAQMVDRLQLDHRHLAEKDGDLAEDVVATEGCEQCDQ